MSHGRYALVIKVKLTQAKTGILYAGANGDKVRKVGSEFLSAPHDPLSYVAGIKSRF